MQRPQCPQCLQAIVTRGMMLLIALALVRGAGGNLGMKLLQEGRKEEAAAAFAAQAAASGNPYDLYNMALAASEVRCVVPLLLGADSGPGTPFLAVTATTPPPAGGSLTHRHLLLPAADGLARQGGRGAWASTGAAPHLFRRLGQLGRLLAEGPPRPASPRPAPPCPSRGAHTMHGRSQQEEELVLALRCYRAAARSRPVPSAHPPARGGAEAPAPRRLPAPQHVGSPAERSCAVQHRRAAPSRRRRAARARSVCRGAYCRPGAGDCRGRPRVSKPPALRPSPVRLRDAGRRRRCAARCTSDRAAPRARERSSRRRCGCRRPPAPPCAASQPRAALSGRAAQPDLAEAHFNLGSLSRARGAPADAAAHLARAVRAVSRGSGAPAVFWAQTYNNLGGALHAGPRPAPPRAPRSFVCLRSHGARRPLHR